MSDSNVISQIYAKIEREKALINAAQAMRQSSNFQVQQSLDAQIKQGRKNLEYLEQRLRDQEMRQVGQGMEGMSIGSGSNGGPQPPAHGASLSPSQRNNSFGTPSVPPKGSPDFGSYGTSGQGRGYMDNLSGGSGMMPPRPPYGPSAPTQSIPKARPNYSKLDLIKADTQHLGPRFQLMLSQLTFKLTIERQYLDGIEKLIKLYSDDGDRRSKVDAVGRRTESQQKIQLLSQALKRYEDLHVDMETPDVQDDDSINSPQLRKPLSGHLALRIYGVRDVQHAITGKFSRGPETFAIIKVEDAFKGRTKATRTDKWTDEVHSIEVDKANEIELTVYDKTGPHPTPIGLLWIRISDIVEEMRRKKIESELSGSQWVTAEQMDNNPKSIGAGSFGGTLGTGAAPSANYGASAGRAPGPGSSAAPGEENESNIDAWFSLEPVGSIHLSMIFNKHNKGKAAFDLGLNRKGAVRQRKEEVMEQYGHKFVTQQFYSIMRCALCGEFLKNAAGMQCEDCKYTCHRNCYTKVVTKCISKSNAETDPDEETLNHRIPHRFEPFSNLSANWCCHCGYMLTFGKKNARKCSECSLTVHGTCAHLVPNFCGMSMLRANEILTQIGSIPKRPAMAGKTLRTDKPGRPLAQTSPSYMETTSQEHPRPQADPRRSYPSESPYESRPQPGQPLAHDAAKAVQALPQSPDRPTGMRTTSTPQNPAAAAASHALQGQVSRPAAQKTSSYGQPSSSDYGRPAARTSGGYQPTAELGSEGYGQQRQTQQSTYNPQHYASFDNVPQPGQYGQPQAVKQAPATQTQAIQAPTQQNPQQPVVKQPSAQPPQSKSRVGLEHFNFLAVLGKGNFGKVMLAETKASKKLYAIKVLKKEFIIENDEVESTKSEKRVFLVANKERHPFLLSLHACFQTETRVYFVMEYISGGDLMLHIQRGQFGLKRAQFYASEVCLALKYFHENGVIYRDLKLDNILLTLDGHIKIADYGLCKEDMWYGSTTSTFCGTPEFMAPEILLDKKYGRAVDWWAFGVLIYQMLLQQSPFRGEDEDEIYDAILADEPLYPIHMPRDSVSILQKLLTREPELRLGSGPTDAQEIMSHAFFRNVNWEDVRNKRVPPPFQPNIKNATDTSNFDSEFTSVTPVLTPVQSVLTQAMQEEFRGFSYSADFV